MSSRRSDIEFYREMMEHFQEESASKSERLDALMDENRALREEIAALRGAHAQDMESLRQSHEKSLNDLKESHRKAMESLQASFEKRLEHMAEINAGFSTQLSEALASGKLARAKKYGRSSEQKALLNNRKEASRKSEEDDSDGNPPAGTDSGGQASSDNKPAKKSARASKRKPDSAEGKTRYDVVIDHPLEEFEELPAGARLLSGTSFFELVKYIPARTECHRYPYRRFIIEQDEDPDIFGDTLPQSIRDLRPVSGCPMSAEVMGFIFAQKYAYHQPQKRIRTMLKDMGVHIPKKTFNRYVMKGADELLTLLGNVYRTECSAGNYFMVDETVVNVGVDDKELGRRYLNRYMWEFYNRTVNLVEYVYENGSRGRKVLKEFFGDDLKMMEALISCDGYNAYRLFDSDDYPAITVIGCWSHARRNFVDALEVSRPQCEEMLDMIGSMFEIEAQCSEAGLDSGQRLECRQRKTKPLLKTIKATAERMWNDTGLMAIGLLKKAVGYIRNQWDHLSNILKSGLSEISNNLSEQRIRPLKLSLKNCLNIGSEKAASLHAFMYSLAESCRLNSVNIQEYFTLLFSKARSKLEADDLIALLPNHNPLKC